MQLIQLFHTYMLATGAGFGTPGGFGASAFGTTTNTGGLFGSTQNKPGLSLIKKTIDWKHVPLETRSDCYCRKCKCLPGNVCQCWRNQSMVKFYQLFKYKLLYSWTSGSCSCLRWTFWARYIQPAGHFLHQHRLWVWSRQWDINQPVWQLWDWHHKRTLLTTKQCIQCKQTHFFWEWVPSLCVFRLNN